MFKAEIILRDLNETATLLEDAIMTSGKKFSLKLVTKNACEKNRRVD